jgi:hypothetical protein
MNGMEREKSKLSELLVSSEFLDFSEMEIILAHLITGLIFCIFCIKTKDEKKNIERKQINPELMLPLK